MIKAMATKMETKQLTDQYLAESCRSYQKCHVANLARRNSLVKKNIGIETERKLCSHRLDQEKKKLREHLETIQVGHHTRACYCSSTAKDKTDSDTESPRPCTASPLSTAESIDPYPVTFCGKIPSKRLQRRRSMTSVDKGHSYASLRNRRVSKEFEDMNLGGRSHGTVLVGPGSPVHQRASTASPSSVLRSRFGQPSSPAELADHDHLWVGDPEAIHSVRRARKTVAQQDHERMQRLVGR